MTKETEKLLEEAKGTIKFNINGLDHSQVEMSGINSGASLFIAAKQLIATIAYTAHTSEAEALEAVVSFIKDSRAIVAESPEQADVINEILKQRGAGEHE